MKTNTAYYTFKAIFIDKDEDLLLQKEEFGINDTIKPNLIYTFIN